MGNIQFHGILTRLSITRKEFFTGTNPSFSLVLECLAGHVGLESSRISASISSPIRHRTSHLTRPSVGSQLVSPEDFRAGSNQGWDCRPLFGTRTKYQPLSNAGRNSSFPWLPTPLKNSWYVPTGYVRFQLSSSQRWIIKSNKSSIANKIQSNTMFIDASRWFLTWLMIQDINLPRHPTGRALQARSRAWRARGKLLGCQGEINGLVDSRDRY